jgi:hypothetical protein
MTIYKRTRIMLLIAVALLGVAMWVIVDQQRPACSTARGRSWAPATS